MYAIRNKKTKKWAYGTDYRKRHYHGLKGDGSFKISYEQRTSYDQALTYDEKKFAEHDMFHRRCGKDYEIVEVYLLLKEELEAKDYLIDKMSRQLENAIYPA